MDNDRHSDRSPLEEQFCVFKIFKMSAILKMVAKTRHKNWAVKIQHCPISSKFYMWVDNDVPNLFLTLKKFLLVATIPQKFNIIRYHENLICG